MNQRLPCGKQAGVAARGVVVLQDQGGFLGAAEQDGARREGDAWCP